MPSAEPTQSRTSHPALGPGIAIYDDRGKTRLRLVVWIAMVPLGVFGIWLGWADLAAGSPLPGIAQALGGVILAGYSVRAAVTDARRLRIPIRLVIARDGFAIVPGTRTISWDEIEAIGDRRSPAGQPRTLRVQLRDPGGFERRHALSPLARLALRFNRGDLLLGGAMAMPVVTAENLMRTRLADFRRFGSASATAPVHPREPKKRRSGRTR